MFLKSISFLTLLICSSYLDLTFSEKSARIIRKMWEESELSIEIDVDKLSEYLGKILTQEEIDDEAFTDLVYTKKVEEKKKKKVTKKIGRKHLMKKKIVKAKGDNENVDKDKEEKNNSLDISISEGDDTLNTIEKKKKSTVEWIKPKRSPTKLEERKMFGKALETMLITCMNHHLYQFENTVRI